MRRFAIASLIRLTDGHSVRVVFVGDGKLTGELIDPTTDQVIDHLRSAG